MCMSLAAQSCLTLCNPMDCSPPGSSAHGIFQVRKLEWVTISSSRGIFPDPGIEPMSPASPALAGGFFSTEPAGKSCFTLISKYSHTKGVSTGIWG